MQKIKMKSTFRFLTKPYEALKELQMNIRLEKNEKSIEKLDEIKKAMRDRTTVYFENKPYTVQAIRLCNSQLYGGLIYQAELVSTNPLQWNSVIFVALEKVEV
jgi:hypothetical protein